jgi:hypothetical protein
MISHNEAFRGVVWTREQALDNNGKPVYRYAIVGMLVTDTPIAGLDPNETVIDSEAVFFDNSGGIAVALSNAKKFKAAAPLGDASSVLCSLNKIVGEPL